MKMIAKLLTLALAAVLCVSTAGMSASGKVEQKETGEANGFVNSDLSLKKISSHSWESSEVTSIAINYDNHIDNIVIEGSSDNSVKFDEYNSVDNKVYAANAELENGTLTLTQSSKEPSSGHDSEARLYIPQNFSGTISVANKGNIKVFNLNGASAIDVTNETGIVSFMSVTAQMIKVSAPDSVSGILTMRDVDASIDISVIGRITINGNSVVGGTINGDDGTWCSTIVMNILSLKEDLHIQNKYGQTVVGFASDASFNIDVTGLNISNAYPGDHFQSTRTTLTGSSGVEPVYTLTSDTGAFTLSAVN